MKRKYRFELHVHTRYSSDSILSFLFLLTALKFNKIDCVAITDHNEVSGAIKYKKKLGKYGINVVVGEEIFTKDGEVIGLFLTKKIASGLSCEDTIKQIKEQGGVVYIPHPYDPHRSKTVLKEECIKNNKNSIDLIEVHNGRNRNYEISEKQLAISSKYKILPVVGSDAHTFFEIGRNYIIVDEIPGPSNIKSCIKKGVFFKKKCLKYSHGLTKIAKALKMIRSGKINELCRIIFK